MYLSYGRNTLTEIFKCIGRNKHGRQNAKRGKQIDKAKLAVYYKVFDGLAPDEVYNSPEVRELLDNHMITQEKLKEYARDAVILLGHKREKRMHHDRTLELAADRLKKRKWMILEHCPGGVGNRKGGQTEAYEHMVATTGGDLHHFPHGDGLSRYRDLKAVLGNRPIRVDDGVGYNLACIDGWSNYLIWELLEEGYFDLLDPEGCILHVSTFMLAPRGMPENLVPWYKFDLGSLVPTHTRMREYIIQKAELAGRTCELIHTQLLDDHMRQSFLIKA